MIDLSGMSYEAKRLRLRACNKKELEDVLLNDHYNGFISEYDSYDQDEDDTHGCGKRIPYIGWYWRHVDFASRRIPIGNCGDFVGFMENNKWDYPERRMTEEEIDAMLAILDEAIRLSEQGGQLSEIVAATKAKLDELWPLFQTFSVLTRRLC